MAKPAFIYAFDNLGSEKFIEVCGLLLASRYKGFLRGGIGPDGGVDGELDEILGEWCPEWESPLLNEVIKPGEKVDEQLRRAKDAEDFQTVGVLCRETLISVAQAVYDHEIHRCEDGDVPSPTDAKRMLEAYIGKELKGGKNEVQRKVVKGSVDLAVGLQHKRTATRQDATSCAEATRSMVTQIAIIAGRHGSVNGLVKIADSSDMQVELSYRSVHCEALEHLYEKIVTVSNKGSHTVNSFKLELAFPDLDSIHLKWVEVLSATQRKKLATLTEVSPTSEAVEVTKKGNQIHVVYQSEDVLYPGDQVDLSKVIGLRYRVNTSIFINMQDLLPLRWTLYADNMPPKSGETPLSELSNF